MNERTILIGEYLSGGYSVSELARRRGISRKTAFKWIDRYEEEGWEGLKDQSRAPHHQPGAISHAMEERILELKGRWPLWGAPKIHAKLQGFEDCPSESTVSNILQRHGLSRRQRRRGQATPSQLPLSYGEGSNEVWCADFKGCFRTGDGRRCEPLTISDAHSRYLLCCRAVGSTTVGRRVQPLFEVTFREYGLPLAIRTDNGPPFASSGLGGLTTLSVWWLRLDIGLQRIQPGRPQQNGRHERMHRTLKEATAKPPHANLAQQQRALERFRREYNEDRPHEALGQKPPASVYEPSVREFPSRVPSPEYPDDWQIRKVSPGGQVRWRGQKLHISHALIDQHIGFKPIGDGLWVVFFAKMELAQWNERSGQIVPIRTLPVDLRI